MAGSCMVSLETKKGEIGLGQIMKNQRVSQAPSVVLRVVGPRLRTLNRAQKEVESLEFAICLPSSSGSNCLADFEGSTISMFWTQLFIYLNNTSNEEVRPIELSLVIELIFIYVLQTRRSHGVIDSAR